MKASEFLQKYLVLAVFGEEGPLVLSQPMELTSSEVKYPSNIYLRFRDLFLQEGMDERPDQILLVKNDVVKHHFVLGKDY